MILHRHFIIVILLPAAGVVPALFLDYIVFTQHLSVFLILDTNC